MRVSVIGPNSGDRYGMLAIAGEKSRLFCGFFLSISLFGSSVVYTLTSATSMR
jgi:hypothetical protein